MNAHETAEAAKQKRAAELARVRTAAQNLAENKDFTVLFEHLQYRFPLTSPSFREGDEGNTHAAAKRDGNKQVVAYMLKLLSLPKEADFEDEETRLRPAVAVSEIG